MTDLTKLAQSKVDSTVSSATSAVSGVVNSAAGAVSGAVSAASGAVNSAISTANGAFSGAAALAAMKPISAAEAKAKSLIPVSIPKPFKRDEYPGNTTIEKIQHTAIEQGRVVERSVGDALYNIKEAKANMMGAVNNCLNLNKLANTVQIPDDLSSAQNRIASAAGNIQDFTSQAQQHIQEIQGLIKALEGVVGHLQMVKGRIQGFIQGKLNAISTLIHNICNFNFPDLPAIPSLLGGIHFSGFAWPAGAFKFALKFDANFAFGSCKVRKPNTNIFRNYPNVPFGLGPNGIFGPRPTLNPPLPNSRIATATENKDTIRKDKKPVFRPDFFPTDSFTGSLPNPNQIISSYEMPTDVFNDHVLSQLGDAQSIIADMNPAGTLTSTGESTALPALDATKDVDYYRTQLQPAIRAYSIRKVNLETIVASNWDWRVVWAWLTYVHGCRAARGGTWIPAYDDVYSTWVLPGYYQIENMAILWHTDPDTPDTASSIKQGPASPLLFISNLKALNSLDLGRVLWKLSYVEASLLGYTRSTLWDGYSAPGYVDGSTQDDLDYQVLPPVLADKTKEVVLDSSGLANYPSHIIAPEYVLTNLQTVITRAYKAICAASSYTAPHLANRYVYNQLAEAIEINSHSQFWKEFRTNWDGLMQEDVALQGIVFDYPDVLESCLNPLGDTGLFDYVKRDYLNRTAGWVPGYPLLPTPYIPTMVYPAAGLELPVGQPNGWGGVAPGYKTDPQTGDQIPNAPEGSGGNVDVHGNPVPLVFDEDAFLKRPDVQALPPNAQSTLLYLNSNYQQLLAIQDVQLGVVNDAIADANNEIEDLTKAMAALKAMLPATHP